MDDIGPTILDLAGCNSPKMEAITMAPALRGDDWQGRDYLFCEQVGDMVLTEVKFMTMIRNKEWKLVHYLDSEEGQLYNLNDDPAENQNLWGHEEYKSQKELLLSELLKWRVKSQLHHPTCWIYES